MTLLLIPEGVTVTADHCIWHYQISRFEANVLDCVKLKMLFLLEQIKCRCAILTIKLFQELPTVPTSGVMNTNGPTLLSFMNMKLGTQIHH